MRLDIRYRMSFEYGSAVSESYNEVRARPRDLDGQRVVSYRLTSMPDARPATAVDYWGTTVDHVGIRGSHRSLELVAEAAVDTDVPSEQLGDAELSELSGIDFRAEHWEFLQPSAHVQWGPSIEALSADAAGDADSVTEVIDRAMSAVHSGLDYRSGSTEIGIPLDELLAGGRGVCQDYAHLAIAVLRIQRIPARYVSGYLFTADETRTDGPTSDVVSVQTRYKIS